MRCSKPSAANGNEVPIDFVDTARAVKVKFHSTAADAERCRWELDSHLEVNPEERTLAGFNLVLAVSNVQTILSSPSHPASDYNRDPTI